LNQVFCVVMHDHGYFPLVLVIVEPSILCHDHALPHRILGSTMTRTNETYPWSFITTQNTWFNHDYDKGKKSMIIHYHTEYLVCFVCRSHRWTKYSVWWWMIMDMFCLYMYTFVLCTLTSSGTIIFNIFCERCLSLFSWFNKVVVSKVLRYK
jgi:hypothetical protein